MGWRAVALLSFGTIISLTCLVLACVLTNDYWPFLVLLPFARKNEVYVWDKANVSDLFVLVMALPAAFCSPSDSLSDQSGITQIGDFTLGILVTSTFALPAVLNHNDKINSESLGLTLASNIVLYASVLGYTLVGNAGYESF